jgi:hypothetical protein
LINKCGCSKNTYDAEWTAERTDGRIGEGVGKPRPLAMSANLT